MAEAIVEVASDENADTDVTVAEDVPWGDSVAAVSNLLGVSYLTEAVASYYMGGIK